MAVGNLDRIATFLLDGGRRPATPVACVQHAGTPRQRVTSCLLADLAVPEVSRRIQSPAVVVIGPTVPALLRRWRSTVVWRRDSSDVVTAAPARR